MSLSTISKFPKLLFLKMEFVVRQVDRTCIFQIGWIYLDILEGDWMEFALSPDRNRVLGSLAGIKLNFLLC